MPAELTVKHANESDVPARIVAKAIELFGRYGTHAKSVREVLRAAGVANEAAVRYYFGNKQGLLEACVKGVAARLQAYYEESWAELDQLKLQREITVVDVVRSFSTPFLLGVSEDRQGIALVARLIREEGEAGQDLILESFNGPIWRAEQELKSLLPKKSERALRLHLFLAINNLVNGMVDRSLLWRLPSTESENERYSLGDEQLLTGFIEYLAAGIAADSTI